MNEQLTEEELHLLINDDKLFNEYDLGNIYTVIEDASYLKTCLDCQMSYHSNKEKFYNFKYTVCIDCSKLRSFNLNKRKKHLKGTEYSIIQKSQQNAL